MLRVNDIRDNVEGTKAALKKRYYSEEDLQVVDKLIELDDLRKSLKTELDNNLATSNRLSKEIGMMYKEGLIDQANEKKEEVSTLKNSIKELESRFNETKDSIEEMLFNIPNLPHESVKVGKDDTENEEVQSWDEALPSLGSDAKPHWELAEDYNLFDFKLGAKITGSGFPLYINQGARLQRALISFFLDEATSAGYTEIIPPLLVNEATARGTGQLPDKEGQMYYVEKDDLYLIPTSEVPLANIVRGEMLDKASLPLKFTGYTPCFRREAGSYGADVKGLNRVHQFDKVELVQIVHPDESYKTLDQMVLHVEGLLKKLKLPYRILRLCSGDMGFTATLTYDFEVYSAAQEKWLEVSSVSNCESYQAHRLNCRFKNDQGKTQYVHTLNGSGLALARIVAALLENNQTENGIVIPEVLRPYTGFDSIEKTK